MKSKQNGVAEKANTSQGGRYAATKELAALLLFTLLSSAYAGENEIRKSLQSKFPGIGKIEHVVKTPYAGLYEVVIEDQLYYIDAQGEYLFEGNIIETKSRRDISGERRRVLFAVDFDKLPLELAVKKVKGNGKRKLAIFTDPNCSFCKRLEKELSVITDVTLYFFMYPIFPGSDEIVRNVLCAKNPIKAWDDWMLSEITPAQATCDTQTEQVLALGKKLHVNGTPNLIFANGIQAPGLLPVEELEKNLNQPGKK
ncbi:MAG: DsbC family protein [Nitrosomonadales bacterium]|nr:DsbC family protein [Nitrosomonadales bacterium]